MSAEEPRGTIHTIHAGGRPAETIEYGPGRPSDYEQAVEYWGHRIKRGWAGKIRRPAVDGSPVVEPSLTLPREAQEGWLTEPEAKRAGLLVPLGVRGSLGLTVVETRKTSSCLTITFRGSATLRGSGAAADVPDA